MGLSAIFIDDLTLIFGIIAGLAECTTVFILPSVLYLVACRQEDKKHEAYDLLKATQSAPSLHKRPSSKKGGGTFVRACVCAYMSVGLMYFCVSNYFLGLKIFGA